MILESGKLLVASLLHLSLIFHLKLLLKLKTFCCWLINWFPNWCLYKRDLPTFSINSEYLNLINPFFVLLSSFSTWSTIFHAANFGLFSGQEQYPKYSDVLSNTELLKIVDRYNCVSYKTLWTSSVAPKTRQLISLTFSQGTWRGPTRWPAQCEWPRKSGETISGRTYSSQIN